MKKVGIIGSGAVAKSLGNGFLKYGYEVMLSLRDTSKLAEWKEQGGNTAYTGSFREAASFGDIIVLAVRLLQILLPHGHGRAGLAKFQTKHIALNKHKRSCYTAKLSPHPHVLLALGLLK